MDVNVVALAGGVGGAKLADGLAREGVAGKLTVVVNTGDDFEHLGLRICPDLDTVVYTLAGLADPVKGWGRADESWHFLETLGELGGPTWFRLGDRDLALHAFRTDLLARGVPLSEVTRRVCAALDVKSEVLPMSDDPMPTIVLTPEGEMPFQEYFVARRCEPAVRGFRFEGVTSASPAPGVLAAIEAADFIVFCPSNPWVSLDPILAVPGVQERLQDKVVVAVSPIIGGKAVKGPAARMFAQLGTQPGPAAVAEHYQGLLSGILIDEVDQTEAQAIEAIGIRVMVTDILMRSLEDRERLARQTLQFAAQISGREGQA